LSGYWRDEENREARKFAGAFLSARRNINALSPDNQRSLGIQEQNPKMTIRMLVDAFDGDRLLGDGEK
jgi:hypothetical protein